MKQLQLAIKRLFDFSAAFILLTIVSPFLILFSILILITDGRPVFFIQNRPGLHGKIFKILKFRTMRTQKEGQNLFDHQRTTKLGSFIRKSSIDELPQLINVLKGELSLVGPRPLLPEYLPLYSKEQKKRHNVKPGITGWAQINGRNTISWEQKFDYDVWYVDNWSLLLDFKILVMTCFKILKSSDVNSSNDVTMEKFKGSQ